MSKYPQQILGPPGNLSCGNMSRNMSLKYDMQDLVFFLGAPPIRQLTIVLGAPIPGPSQCQLVLSMYYFGSQPLGHTATALVHAYHDGININLYICKYICTCPHTMVNCQWACWEAMAKKYTGKYVGQYVMEICH